MTAAQVLVLALVIGSSGCSDDRGAPPRAARAAPASHKQQQPPGRAATPITRDAALAEPIGCGRAFVDGRVVVPTDLGVAAAGSATCARRPAHGAARIYDDCTDESWSSTGCAVPYGAQFCHAGAWTVVCQRDTDCPSAMRCTYDEGVGNVDVKAWGYGWCAMRCTSDASCGRCDHYCDRGDGVCRARVQAEDELGDGEDERIE